jgi:hypothetical protein
MVLKSKIPRAIIYRISLACVICLTLLSCKHEEPFPLYGPEINFTGWDTTTAVGAIDIPDAAMLSRALMNTGDECRLKAFFNKLHYNKEIRIGFIGGSITEGSAASEFKKCYAVSFCSFLDKAFPGIDFLPYDAGIGATDSRFGCSRVQDDLLLYQPDLMVIEYSVNDAAEDTLEQKSSIEGLVRQCLNTGAAVIMLCMRAQNQNDDMQNLHLSVGNYYNIPVISYYDALNPLLQSGSLSWGDISPDGIHPNDLGHFITASLLYKFIRSAYINLGSDYCEPAAIPGFVYTDMYEFASAMKTGDTAAVITENHGWQIIPKVHERVGFISSHQGDSLILHTAWRELTLMYWYHEQQNGLLEISLDGQRIDTLSNYFAGGGTAGFMRKARLFLDNNAVDHDIVLHNLANEPFEIRYTIYAP